MKVHEWKLEAHDLMAGKFVVPAKAKVWRYREWAVGALERAAARDSSLSLRVWQVPGGWVVLNHHLEALAKRRDHRNVWYALLLGRQETTA